MIDTSKIMFINLNKIGNISKVGYSYPRNNKTYYVEDFSNNDQIFNDISSFKYYFAGDDPALATSPNGGASSSGIVSFDTFNIFSNDKCIEIKICGEIKNRDNDARYNEYYIWFGPSNYIYYSPFMTYDQNNISSTLYREGIMFSLSHKDGKIYYLNHNSYLTATSAYVIKQFSPNIYLNEWNDFCVSLKQRRGNELSVDITMNNVLLVKDYLIGNILSLNWLNNFRYAVCADDQLRKICFNHAITPKTNFVNKRDTIFTDCSNDSVKITSRRFSYQDLNSINIKCLFLYNKNHF